MNKDTNQIMALLNAYRMDGLGNNFLIIDRRQNALEVNKERIIHLANKKIFSFDQLITLEKEEKNEHPIKIFNPDGIEVNACGNGARCIAYLINQENKQKNISIKTKERVLRAEIVGKKNVKINMGKPKFGWEDVPLSKNMNTKELIKAQENKDTEMVELLKQKEKHLKEKEKAFTEEEQKALGKYWVGKHVDIGVYANDTAFNK